MERPGWNGCRAARRLRSAIWIGCVQNQFAPTVYGPTNFECTHMDWRVGSEGVRRGWAAVAVV
jgi:hypothetical protein